jgi:hypothetical protein
MTDPLTGQTVNAQLGSDRRLKTIYQTNMRQAYIYGEYKRIMESDLHTHIMYRIGASVHHRPTHLQWDGLILPKDDPFWRLHLPQKEYGCKCNIRAVSEYQKKKYETEGITVPPRIDGTGGGKLQVKTKAPPEVYHMFYNERKGTFEKVPDGVHPSFNWDFTKNVREKMLKEKLRESRHNYNAVVKIVPSLTSREKIARIQEAANTFFKSLSPKQVIYSKVYSRGFGAEINKTLYALGKDWVKSDKADTIRVLDGIIEKAAPLAETVFFFKGDESRFWTGSKIGDLVPVSGFFSTTILKTVAERYATDKLRNGRSPVMVVIRAPTGSKGLYIGNKTAYPEGNEYEFLLPRNSLFRVLEKDDNHILLEVVHEPQR